MIECKKVMTVALMLCLLIASGFAAEAVQKTNIVGYKAIEGTAAKALLSFLDLIKKNEFDEAKNFYSASQLKFHDLFGGFATQKWVKWLKNSDFSKVGTFYIEDIEEGQVKVDVIFYSIDKGGEVGAILTMKKIDGKWVFDE